MHEGRFVGELCTPCHIFITTGEGTYSQAYRNSQREWVGLTEDDLSVCKGDEAQVLLAKYWETKLKQKNTMTPEVTPLKKRQDPCGND
jgi:hypothetical protein